MAVNYSVPNWIHGADTTGAYSKGFGLGLQGGEMQARLAIERNRLAQDSQRTSVELALKQQQNERDNLIEQQKLEVAKAYHQQETDLKARQLDQAEQLMKEKLQHAAEETMAISNYKNAIANNEDPTMAALKHLVDVKGTNSMLAAAIRTHALQTAGALSSEPKMKQFTTPDGRTINVIYNPNNPKSGIHVDPGQKELELSADKLSTMTKNLPFQKRVLGTNYPGIESSLAKLYQEKLNAQTKKLGASATSTATPAPKVNPWPSNPDDMKKDELYQHPNGVFQYNGKDANGKAIMKFVSPNAVPQASASEADQGDQFAEGDTTDTGDGSEEA